MAKINDPAKIDVTVIAALQALRDGVANAGQQKAALHWILFDACRLRELSFDPASETGTAFAEGRRFVGLQIAGCIEADIPKQKQAEQARP